MRIFMRTVPGTASISPTNVAERSIWLTEVTQASVLALAIGLPLGASGTPVRLAPAGAAANSAAAVHAQAAASRARRPEGASRMRDIAFTTSLTRLCDAGFGLQAHRQHGDRRAQRPRRRSGDLIQRPVAALGRRQTPALGGDRTALHAVGVVDDHVDRPLLGGVLGDLIDPRRAHPAPG